LSSKACGDLDDICAAVGRAVVDDEHFVMRVALAQHRAQRTRKKALAVENGDDDRNELQESPRAWNGEILEKPPVP